MDINLENLQENKNLYNACMKDIMEKRSNLMKQEGELEEKKDLLVDDDEIARIDNEKAKIAHEINLLTTLFENSKLELEIIQLQEKLLKNMITETEYNNSITEIQKQKEQLSISNNKLEQEPTSSDELTQEKSTILSDKLNKKPEYKQEQITRQTDKQTKSLRERIKFELTTQMHANILENYIRTKTELPQKNEETPKEEGREFDSIA